MSRSQTHSPLRQNGPISQTRRSRVHGRANEQIVQPLYPYCHPPELNNESQSAHAPVHMMNGKLMVIQVRFNTGIRETTPAKPTWFL